MPEVSIIVPVYNVEPYLCRCVDSILSQTFTDFELILVDDGSPDNCGTICDQYAEKDKRIKVIHKKNGGAAAARNSGLSQAQGEFIAFCDGDDYVSPLWLERLVSASDIGIMPICAYCEKDELLGSPHNIRVKPSTLYSKREYFLFNTAGVAGFLWNTLFCRRILDENQICMREQKELGDYNEDLLFTLQYVRHMENIIYTGYSDYCYRIHSNSLSRASGRFQFDKNAEKHRLWRQFIDQESGAAEDQLKQLSNITLYCFVGQLRKAEKFEDIKRVVVSDEMQDCLYYADTDRENPFEMKLLQHKNAYGLYIFYSLLRLKERIQS